MRIVIQEAGFEYKTASERRIMTPADAGKAASELAQMDKEAFAVLNLDTKNGMISADVVTVGIVDASLIHPRECFRQAVKANACAIVLVHNHPTGDTTPSAEDIRITRQLVEAGKVLDIKVLDHVIIGKGSNGAGLQVLSMREQGIVDFTA